jgi:hypothetical protein
VIGAGTRIVISSEWDFSPQTIVTVDGLPDFVFVGLPASESDNGFLLPLAGHELGHSLWRRNNEQNAYENLITDELLKQIRARWAEFTAAFPHIKDQKTLTTDPTSVAAWRLSWQTAKRQCEEIFCDLVGLRLFGESYVKAFAWLIAPGLDGRRSSYPLARSRAEMIARASVAWGIKIPVGFEDHFTATPGKAPFALQLADSSSDAIAVKLIAGVDSLIASKSISLPRPEVVDRVAAQLLHAVPSITPATLQELLCGAWRLRDQAGLWSSYPHLARDTERILNELLLKSAQCLEWRTRLEADV